MGYHWHQSHTPRGLLSVLQRALPVHHLHRASQTSSVVLRVKPYHSLCRDCCSGLPFILPSGGLRRAHLSCDHCLTSDDCVHVNGIKLYASNLWGDSAHRQVLFSGDDRDCTVSGRDVHHHTLAPQRHPDAKMATFPCRAMFWENRLRKWIGGVARRYKFVLQLRREQQSKNDDGISARHAQHEHRTAARDHLQPEDGYGIYSPGPFCALEESRKRWNRGRNPPWLEEGSSGIGSLVFRRISGHVYSLLVRNSLCNPEL